MPAARAIRLAKTFTMLFFEFKKDCHAANQRLPGMRQLSPVQ
jgi:hypothetical protein